MATRPRRALRPAPRERTPLRVLPGRGARPLRASLVPAAVILVLAVFAVAGLQAYLAQEGFHAAKLERDLRHEEERFSLLRAEAARLSSPSRLAEEAHRLGMTEPADPIFLRAPGAVPERAEDDMHTPYTAKRLLAEVP
jgi:hypothetical protein